MKTKSRSRFAAVFLALAMLLSFVPVEMFVSMRANADTTAAAAEDPKYVLESKNLTAFASGKGDGDSEKAGTSDYFTLYYSAKSKVDSSSKDFDDGYSSSQRVNFGGKADATTPKNVISFKTSGAATVKVWWVEGTSSSKPSEYREMTILGSNGSEAASTNEHAEKGALCISTLNLSDAGTYYLGGKQNNNYIFKVEVTEHLPKNYVFEAKNLTAFASGKGDGDSEKAGTSDYFTLYYSAKSKVDSSSKDFDDGYSSSQRVNFGGKADATTPKNVISFKTSGAATVKVWWVEGTSSSKPSEYREMTILGSNGSEAASTNEHAEKGALCISTLNLSDAGTYYLGGKQNNNYIFKVEVTEGASSAPVERGDWADVDAPVIDSVAQTSGKAEIKVNVTADVSAAGGDEVVVKMYKDGEEAASKRSIAEKTSHELTFNPTASGTYTFKATLSRDGETDKKSAADGTCSFVLPLAKPAIASATNKGNGSIEVKWGAVAEATGYEIYINGTKVGTSATTSYIAAGLTVGTAYKFTVAAVRNAEIGSKSDEVSATAKSEEEREWSTTYFGASTGKDKNKVEGDLNNDGKINVIATGNGGKVVPGGNGSGVTYYYTTIPDSLNFTLKGTFTLKEPWTLSNGQEGFGLLALDRLPAENLNNTAPFWTNQYLMGMTKNEYRWDSEKGQFSYDDNVGDKYSMKNGVCVSAVIDGLTPENLSQTSDTNFVKTIAPSHTFSLEKYAVDMGQPAGTYNVIGNSTAELSGTIKSLTTFVFELQRNNTGYFMTYYDENGKIVGQQKFYDTQALSKLDSEKVFVGFFAARNVKVEVSNVSLTTIAPKDDAPAEERPVELIEPSLGVLSATVANGSDYTLMLNSNVAGTAEISVNGKAAGSGDVAAKTLFSKALALDEGVNKISVVFKPDPNQVLPEYTKLANTDPITAEINVTYNARFANQKNLYVSPKGNKYGNGGKDYPLDIHTAVSVVRPGQTIVIMEGTYSLTSPVRIERGMDGTAEAKIRMVADPEATSRPVFDFNKVCEGFRLGGNYWYVKGFDVTNTGNGLAGFRVCGNYNTLDLIEAYNNGNTGIQISAFRDSSDPRELWPHDNLILNCTSYNNADSGREDADGFAAKLTIGEGNVFDGCAAYNNADDGWDLYAKVSSGPIGSVTIRNCIAYNNGIMLDGSNAGNGNGFKLGGENISGKHKLINSFAFGNKAHGITSNSCPDVQVINCTSYNNGNTAHSGDKDKICNLTLYTNNKDNTTSFVVNGFISCAGKSPDEIKKNTNDTTVESNIKNVTADAFISTTFGGLERNANGTLKLGDFLKLKDEADRAIGADFEKTGSSQPSADIGEIVSDENLPDPLPVEFEDSDIKVTAPIDAFDDVENVKFNANPILDETNEEQFTFDLFFTDKDGNRIQPKTAVTVKIPVPAALKDKTIFVYHVESDGKYTEIDCKIEDGMVVFTATSFSKYIITSKKLAESDNTSDDNPPTGVTIPITGFVVSFAIAAVSCVFKRKNK